MKRKFACFILAGLMLVNSSAVVLADTVTVTGDKKQEVDVTVTITGSYSVSIPKSISATNKKTLEYEINVTGDIAGDEVISVVPDAELTLKQQGKDDVTAQISQDKTEWAFDEVGTKASGTITVPQLSAGTWSGAFNFDISLE